MKKLLVLLSTSITIFSYSQSGSDLQNLSNISTVYTIESNNGPTYNGVTIKSPAGYFFYVTPLSSLGLSSSLRTAQLNQDSLPDWIRIRFVEKTGKHVFHVQALKDGISKSSKLLLQKSHEGNYLDIAVIPLSNLDNKISLHYLQISDIVTNPSFTNNEKLKTIGFSSDNGKLYIMDIELVFSTRELVGARGDLYTLAGLLGAPVYKLSAEKNFKLLSFIDGVAKTNREALIVSSFAGCIVDILKDK